MSGVASGFQGFEEPLDAGPPAANPKCPEHQYPSCPLPEYVLKIPPKKSGGGTNPSLNGWVGGLPGGQGVNRLGAAAGVDLTALTHPCRQTVPPVPPSAAPAKPPPGAPPPAECAVSLEFLRSFLRRLPGGASSSATMAKVVEDLVRPSTGATQSR